MSRLFLGSTTEEPLCQQYTLQFQCFVNSYISFLQIKKKSEHNTRIVALDQQKKKDRAFVGTII